MVLDEADRMFDLGFIRDIRYLLRKCPSPQERLTMLFSATLSLTKCENLPLKISEFPRIHEIRTRTKTGHRIQRETILSLKMKTKFLCYSP